MVVRCGAGGGVVGGGVLISCIAVVSRPLTPASLLGVGGGCCCRVVVEGGEEARGGRGVGASAAVAENI